MKKLLALIPLALLVFVLLTFFWWRTVSKPADPENRQAQDFLIVRGESAERIGQKLEKEGLVKSKLAFKFYTQLTGQEKKIQAGEYRLSPDLSLRQLVQTLVSGPRELWVTYPEGFRREEIAARTIQTLGLEGSEADNFWFEFLEETQGQEGFLFPDTYLFPKDVSARTVVNKLRATFDAKVKEMISDGDIILASIIERETLTDGERPVVAGILLKRWRAGWPLQADATLQYAVANAKCRMQNAKCERWWEQTKIEDRKINSPYNTYLNPGLPPGPIANPGLSSIKAVIYPEESPYWFYLHDTSGKIHYAETIEEHEENINKYLR